MLEKVVEGQRHPNFILDDNVAKFPWRALGNGDVVRNGLRATFEKRLALDKVGFAGAPNT